MLDSMICRYNYFYGTTRNDHVFLKQQSGNEMGLADNDLCWSWERCSGNCDFNNLVTKGMSKV